MTSNFYADNYKNKQHNNDKLIRAIFSDYDGTLCSARAARDTSLGNNRIPPEIRAALQQISQQIPICIISSKDFFFLKETRGFAQVVSCLMGIETLTFADNAAEHPIHRKLLGENESNLSAQSDALGKIAKKIESEPEFRSIIVERKYTSDRRILAGITVDWRYSANWDYYKKGARHFISALVSNLSQQPEPIKLYLQKYDFHPFADVYATECNKGTAFDLVLSEIAASHDIGKEEEGEDQDHARSSISAEDVLYLGDSENDNPAFRKAGISIGIRSDARINPELDCSYILEYDQLSSFLVKLRKSDYLFSEELLLEARKA
jgi:hydroxymethylpyrimidine pyrophosphatase-like HAD family hydrolase